MSEDDDKLDELYQQRKKIHSAPPRIMAKTLKHHSLSKSKKSIDGKIIWHKYFRQVGFITACLGIFFLALFQFRTVNKPNTIELVSTDIVRHVLKSETIDRQTAHSVEYQLANENYVASQRIINIHHRETAVIATTASGWQLNICGAGKISISPLLLASLAKANAVDPSLLSGQFVQIAYNVDGQIITIAEEMSLLEC